MSRCRERRELLVYALTYQQNSNYYHKQLANKYKSKYVCVCGIEPSSLVTDGVYIYILVTTLGFIYIYIHTYIHTYIEYYYASDIRNWKLM